MYSNPDTIFRAYFESLGKLASPAALTITGMPAAQSSPDHLHVKHADLVLVLRGLTEQQMTVLGFRFAAAAGLREYVRFVGSAEILRAGEAVTGRRHPSNNDLLEVAGVYALGETNAEIAKRLGVTTYAVLRMLSSARGQVREQAGKLGMLE